MFAEATESAANFGAVICASEILTVKDGGENCMLPLLPLVTASFRILALVTESLASFAAVIVASAIPCES